MLKLILNRLRISNFKGIKSADLHFSNSVTVITGHNGVGKSTIADALAWLLRGKNVNGDTDQRFTIKTVDEAGEVIPDLDHEVEGFLTLVNTLTGEFKEIRMRRAFVEEWKTEAGTVGKTLSGHHTDYYWNEIPVKKADYEARIAEIIPAEVFKVITDPYAFLSMPWNDQRAQLTIIAGGEAKPEEIAAGVQKYNDLLRKMNGASLEEYRIKVAADRNRVKAELDKIPIRIDELVRATPEAPNFQEAEARKKEIETELEKLTKAANDIAAANRLQYEKVTELQKQINEQERIKFDALREAQAAANEQILKIKGDRDRAEGEIKQIEETLAASRREETRLENIKYQAEQYDYHAKEITAQLIELRKKFETTSAQEFIPGSIICPRFGHICQDPTACSKGETEFNEGQVKTLNAMRERGHQLGQEEANTKKLAAETLKEYEDKRADLLAARKGLEASLAAALTRRDLLPPVPPTPEVKPELLPKWNEAAKKIADLEAKIQQETQTTSPDLSATHEQRRQLMAELNQVNAKLSLREVIDSNQKRKRDLDAQTIRLAQEKADLEQELMAIEDFNIAIINAVEARVNKHFDLVRFKLFKTLVNGKREPDCIATVKGVAYRDVNTASKINAGLDIIQALTRYYQIQAPIFIDNCESVAEINRPEGSQIIKIQFVKDHPLTVSPQ